MMFQNQKSQIYSDKQDTESEIVGYEEKDRVLTSLYLYQFQSNLV